MGCAWSSEERAAGQRSKQIGEMLSLEAERMKEIKNAEIILIGTRHCGKSSFLKNIETVFCDKANSSKRCSDLSMMEFCFKEANFKLIEVGGRILSRPKLFHYFENVHAIIIIIGLSNYDFMTDAEPPENVLIESMELFKIVCNNKHFGDSLLFLLFSKKDLFEEKLKTTPLTVCFPDFSGGNTFEEAGAYIQLKFEQDGEVNRTERDIYTHFINTADTGNVSFVMEVITEVIDRTFWKIRSPFYGYMF